MADSSEERILYLLKSRGSQTAAGLGRRLGMSSVGARKHLHNLLDRQLVEFVDEPATVGRPKRIWSLSTQGHGRFPDSHADLTVELLGAVRDVFGDDGLDRLIAARERDTVTSYRAELADCGDLAARVRRLAALRKREGYMAESRRQRDGSYLLIENHCPVCAAAAACQGLCRSELAVFQAVLGKGARVHREDHILAGARRCAYRITAAAD